MKVAEEEIAAAKNWISRMMSGSLRATDLVWGKDHGVLAHVLRNYLPLLRALQGMVNVTQEVDICSERRAALAAIAAADQEPMTDEDLAAEVLAAMGLQHACPERYKKALAVIKEHR